MQDRQLGLLSLSLSLTHTERNPSSHLHMNLLHTSVNPLPFGLPGGGGWGTQSMSENFNETSID
jgi:hypothetical protein